MSKELMAAMQLLEEEKGIKPEVIKEALESALTLAYKKNYDQAQNVEVVFDEKTGEIKVYSVKEVVEVNYDSTLEISLEEALKINRAYEIGDTIKFEVTPKDFGRIATQTAKHVVMQRIREAERDIIYEEYIDYEDEILTGTVERTDQRNVYVNIGRVEAILPASEQIPTEEFEIEERIKVYVAKVERTSKGPQIVISRAHPDFLRRLFEQEVPEIYDGIVEIKSIAREAGDRSKVAVYSHEANIDPVGTCVGPRGSRVQSIVSELNGENMDIVEWNEDPAVFIRNAMNPAEVIEVAFNEDDHTCIVVVPDSQLSLAIGKRGQNARLAARLTGYKIDIKSETNYADYLAEQADLQATQADLDGEAALDSMDPEEPVQMGDAVEDLPDSADESLIAADDLVNESVDEAEALADLRLQQDQNEQVLDPEEVEDQISEVEESTETDYETLVDQVQASEESEDHLDSE
ncbi:transcription termination factor NusA [Facklamia languida]|uniref:Transcription termination/antitermination protein NusA n=1 Tax=Facklamia languida CCUG 37842 TaxID=883113 RepID=H3NKI4_9LACT|nr:transcription termination factor NusA [Facklamia languida]EHR36367.1 transcription termination factor NusA [Facklamia languida CCUG 37842]